LKFGEHFVKVPEKVLCIVFDPYSASAKLCSRYALSIHHLIAVHHRLFGMAHGLIACLWILNNKLPTVINVRRQ